MIEQNEQAEINTPILQAENNIKIVLNSARIGEEERVLFLDSLKFLIYGEHNLFNGQPKIKPSIKYLWNISGLSRDLNNRVKLSRLLSHFKQMGTIEFKTSSHIKPIWVKLSNGTLIKNRYSEQVRFIDKIN